VSTFLPLDCERVSLDFDNLAVSILEPLPDLGKEFLPFFVAVAPVLKRNLVSIELIDDFLDAIQSSADLGVPRHRSDHPHPECSNENQQENEHNDCGLVVHQRDPLRCGRLLDCLGQFLFVFVLLSDALLNSDLIG